MECFTFLGHIDPKSEPFVINGFLGDTGHLSGHVYFLLILGHMNQSFETVYFQVFLCQSHHISGTVDFLAFIGHHDLVSAAMDYFSFLGRIFRLQESCFFF